MKFALDFGAITPVPFTQLVRAPREQVGAKTPDRARRAFLCKLHRHRFACLQAAADAVHLLPEEAESVHIIMTGYYDLLHLLIVLLERFGCRCEVLRIATLSLSRRNVQEMAALLDQGKARTLEILCSDFFRKHDEDIFKELCLEFHARGQRVAVARSHAKVVTIALDDGRRYVLSGSPNLRTNRNIEQIAVTRDPSLHAFYDQWLSEMMNNHASPTLH
jgi:hypothetical protein